VLAALNLAFDVVERPAQPVFQPSGFANSEMAGTAPTTKAPPTSCPMALVQRLDHALGDDGRLL
jgi:hypothetical protein